MNINNLPFNISILNINNINKNPLILPVKSLDTFEGSTKNFHPEGLFSQEIFGKMGSKQRQETFSYIDLKCEILHPLIYKAVLELKKMYGEVMKGKVWAKLDPTTGDLEKCDPGTGNTGYHFFMTVLPKIKFKENDSVKRQYNIKLLEKYKDSYRLTKFAVLPAGLRDYEVDEDGKPKKNEINSYYTRIISSSNMIDPNILKVDPASLDPVRMNLQIRILDLYEYLENLLKGKKKMVLGKWGTRKIFNGTRNVITTHVPNTDEQESECLMSFNRTIIGLYEFIKAYLPVSMYNIRQLVRKSLIGPNEPALLIDKESLHKKPITISSDDYDKWMSDEGLEKTLTYFGTTEVRHNLLEINDHYMFLLYLPNNKFFKVIQDIDEIPEAWQKKYPNAIIRPLSFCELLYISMYKRAKKLPGYVTRYPVTSLGSIYPSLCFLKTTITSEQRYEINDSWNGLVVDEETHEPTLAVDFPIPGLNFVETLSPHPTKLKRLNADYDGDTCSFNGVYSDDAIKEVNELMNSKRFYINSNGGITFGMKYDTIEYVLSSLTK